MKVVLTGAGADALESAVKGWAESVRCLSCVQWAEVLRAGMLGTGEQSVADAGILIVAAGPSESVGTLLPLVAGAVAVLPVVVVLPDWDEELGLALIDAGVQDVLADGGAQALRHACLKARSRQQRGSVLPMIDTHGLMQTILDAAPEPIFAKDTESRYVLVNEACCRVMGKDRAAILGRKDHEIFPADLAERIVLVDRSVISGRHSRTYEESVPTPDGTRIFATVKAPVFGWGREPVGLVGVAKDITRRARAQQALEERNRLLALAEDVAHVGHFYISFEDRRVDWSPLCYTLSGVSPETFRPTMENHLQAVHPDDRALLLEAQGEALRERTEVSREVRLQYENGTVRTAVVRLLPDWEPQAGRARALFGIVFDTTDIHRARQAAEQKQELLDMAVEAISDGLVLYDDTDRLVLCNKSFQTMYSLPDDMIRPGTPFEAILRYTFREETGYTDSALLTQWLADRITLHQVGGSVEQQHGGHWHLINEYRLENGFRVGTRVDITSLKEAQLQAAAASRAKSEFLSNMSHELRTPLNAVLGFAQLLLSSNREPLSERQQRSVQHILQAGEHLLTLITEILDLTRIEAGKLVLAPQAFQFGDLVAECLTLTEGLARKHGVTVRLDQEERLPAVWADLTRSRQVVLNLLSNAVKYNRENGTVTVRITASNPVGRLVLEVEDSGRGIPQDRQAILFEPFARLGLETSGIEGTGIGLSISSRLMRAMGGDIVFTSEEGAGSVFRADFPLAPGV